MRRDAAVHEDRTKVALAGRGECGKAEFREGIMEGHTPYELVLRAAMAADGGPKLWPVGSLFVVCRGDSGHRDCDTSGPAPEGSELFIPRAALVQAVDVAEGRENGSTVL